MEDEITIDGVKYREVKEMLPITRIFKGECYNFGVNNEGRIQLMDVVEPELNSVWINDSLDALYKAVEKSKEIRGLK